MTFACLHHWLVHNWLLLLLRNPRRERPERR